MHAVGHWAIIAYLERIKDGKEPRKNSRIGIDCENAKHPCQSQEREKNKCSCQQSSA